MGTKLDFLSGVVKGGYKNQWNVPKAKLLLEYLQKIAESKEPFNPKEAAKITGMSRFSVAYFFKELKQANEAGMTLEEYFEKGRPFQYGKKYVA